jgi:hypothetical protein
MRHPTGSSATIPTTSHPVRLDQCMTLSSPKQPMPIAPGIMAINRWWGNKFLEAAVGSEQ